VLILWKVVFEVMVREGIVVVVNVLGWKSTSMVTLLTHNSNMFKLMFNVAPEESGFDLLNGGSCTCTHAFDRL
jgi:hypothetical protein